MPITPTLSSANFNALSKLISNAGFQRIMVEDDYKVYGKQMKRLLKKSGGIIGQKASLHEVINLSYNHLLNHYRHEYLYKAALLNTYILKNYCLSDTVLLNEFRIGNSKADAVLVNGTNKVFEIKTELDSPERLNNQINDYYKAFSEVYIVIHHSFVEKYIPLIDRGVGIMTFTNGYNIEMLRKATEDQSKLDISTMIKSLRKDEYLAIVEKLTGSIPTAKPVLLFKECERILKNFAPDEVQYEFLKALKTRINPSTNIIVTDKLLPDPLRFSCYQSNLNQNDYLALIKRLNYQF